MNLKQNINKIHIDLSNNFEQVSIEEKSSLSYGNYIELSVINDNKTLKMIIEKKDIENYKFNWKYLANPLNENSDIVERVSTIDGLVNDVKVIFDKNRFNSEYIESIK